VRVSVLAVLLGSLLAGCGTSGSGQQPLSARGLRELAFAARQEQLKCPEGFVKRLDSRKGEQACVKETLEERAKGLTQFLEAESELCRTATGREALHSRQLTCGPNGISIKYRQP
jgi:hypothetical protein